MRRIIKKLAAATTMLIMIHAGIPLNTLGVSTLNSYDFNSDALGSTPSYVTGNAVIVSAGPRGGVLDAQEGKKAAFTPPSGSESPRFSAKVKSAQCFIVRLYDGDAYEELRILPQDDSYGRLYAVLDGGNLSVVYANRQIAERKLTTITKITKAQIENALIDDVAIGDLAIDAMPVNLHMYLHKDKVKLGYITFAPDGGKVNESDLTVSWSDENNEEWFGAGLSIAVPEAALSICCEVVFNGYQISVPPEKVSDLDVLVFDYPVSTTYSSQTGKQMGITLKNSTETAWAATPAISDWSEYDELILRARSRAATQRIYQTNIHTENNYFFTFFTADWANNRQKDVILPIGEESSLDSGTAKNAWDKVSQVDLGTLLSTKQKESGTLTEDEQETLVTYTHVFLRKKKVLKDYTDKEYIINAQKRSNGRDYADSIIKRPHPRLLLTDEKLTTLKSDVVNDEYLKLSYEELQKTVSSSMQKGALKEDDRLRAVEIAQAALFYNLSPSAELMTWINQSVDGLIASTRSEWNYNSESFLSVGDTTRQMAFTYDWMYNHWDDARRLQVRNAIMHCGIEPALPALRSGTRWAGAGHGNWNQSVLSGIGTGVLAICDSESYAELSNELLDRITDSLAYGIRDFSDDGAYREGVSYWHYAMDTFMPFEAALSDICGTNEGLLDSEKMSLAGYFPIMMTGEQGIFSFADANYPSHIRTSAFYRLSEYYHNPVFGAYQYAKSKHIGGDYLAMLLYDTNGYGDYRQYLHNYKYYPGLTESFVMRSNSYLAFKGGQNGISHSQLDIGTFVYDIKNVRWICDLGRDTYNDYGNKTRHYRNRAEGNNCLVINPDTGDDQIKTAFSKVTEYQVGKSAGYGILDMTEAYKNKAASARRGFAMLDDFTTLVVQDEVTAADPMAEVYSFLHTEQIVELSADKKSAVMTPTNVSQRDRQVYVKLLSNCNAELSVMEAIQMKITPHELQFDNSKFKKLAVKATNVKDAKFAVVISLKKDNSSYDHIVSLDEWNEYIKTGEGMNLSAGSDYLQILPNGTNTYTLSAKGLDGAELSEGITYTLKEECRGVSIDENTLTIDSTAALAPVTITASSSADGNTGSITLPVASDYVLVNGEAYAGGSALTEGSNTITARYARSDKKGAATLYIAQYRGNTLQKAVCTQIAAGRVLDLNAALTNHFEKGDSVKVFVWTDKLKPIAETKTVK